MAAAPRTVSFFLSDPWFDLVKDGLKTWEGRSLVNAKAASVKEGDTLVFKKSLPLIFSPAHASHADLVAFCKEDGKTEEIVKRVVEVRKFPTFEEAINTLSLACVLPTISTLEEGLDIYRRFVSKKTETQYGVVMFRLE